MNYESKLIALISSVMPKSPLRKSVSGEVDSELILLGDKEYLFTTDDFSEEDLLPQRDPFGLGWNLACGAISDIIAAGGKPLVYAHSMVIPDYWEEQYIRELSKGVSKVLQKYSVSFIGGDLGVGDHWRYTTSVIGIKQGKPLNRRGCHAGDAIFITGKIGAGNLEAALKLYSGTGDSDHLLQGAPTRFKTHEKLPQIISEYASSAIDTSDGVFAALRTLSELNGTGYKLSNLPFDSKGLRLAKLLHLPDLILFLGECGEYEILFTVPQQDKESLLADLTRHKIKAYELGEITADTKHRTVLCKGIHYDLAEYQIRARDYKLVEDYLQALTDWLKGTSR